MRARTTRGPLRRARRLEHLGFLHISPLQDRLATGFGTAFVAAAMAVLSFVAEPG